uniref:Uncharacterized protein n=1 Tax=Suricata suricatta TaxID=37032 RepID=A0A673T9B7_SURSU
MQAEVNKLELIHPGAPDLHYFQYRLEYEVKTNPPDTAGKKNPVTALKELPAIKSVSNFVCIL